MLLVTMGKKGIVASTAFRFRGGEFSRLEGFSDVVFGFALSLLVVSLEVPKTFDELLVAMHGFLAFAICFAILFTVWHEQYIFFRRYGLQDPNTIVLTAFLLFIILFYVYPLKFLFTIFINQITGAGISIKLPNGLTKPMIEINQVSVLFIIYGLGYISVMLIFALLYLHAYQKRESLALNELEVFDTKSSIFRHILLALVGLSSVALALTVRTNLRGLAGFVYWLIPVVETIHGIRERKLRRILEASFREGSAAT